MANVEELAAGVAEALAKMDAAVAQFQQADSLLDEFQQALRQATQGAAAGEPGEAAGLAQHARDGISNLSTELTTNRGDLAAYRGRLVSPPADSPPPAEPAPATGPEPPNTPAAEPAHVAAARRDLPPPVVKNAGFKTHGRWSTDGATDLAPIVSGKRDDMYAATQAHLAGLGMGDYAIASHVETKLAVHMATTGLTNVTVTINNTPCPGPLGCDTLLPAVLPDGSTLTVYGTNEDGTPTVNTYTGRRKP